MNSLPQVASHAVGILGTGITWAALFGGGTFSVVLVALIRAWPLLTKLAIDARFTLRKEKRDDMAEMRQDINALRGEVAAAVQTANAAETRSAILRAVVSMLTAEISRTDPDNPVLQQAQTMIRDASSGDLGVGRGLQDIAAKVVAVR